MKIKQILILGCLLLVGSAGNVWADRDEEDKVASYLSIAWGAGLDTSAICSSYCSNHHSDGECTDYGQFNGSWDPATLNAVNQCALVSAIVSYYQQKEGTYYSYFCHTPPPKGCLNQTSDGMRFACNDVCSKITSKSTAHKTANAKMAPHPMVMPQNNKALRGNAPQTVRPRGVTPYARGSVGAQPRMMPSVNQGKTAPNRSMGSNVSGHSHETHAPPHPTMMHGDPHHPPVLPPVNQGKTAPQLKHPHAIGQAK